MKQRRRWIATLALTTFVSPWARAEMNEEELAKLAQKPW